MTEEAERELMDLRHRVMVYEALIQADPLREIALRLSIDLGHSFFDKEFWR